MVGCSGFGRLNHAFFAFANPTISSFRTALVGLTLITGSCAGVMAPALAVDLDALSQLLTQRSCERCDLRDADLVHADLPRARLAWAQLQNANLSQGNLNGADLRGADLRGASLSGAALRGADLRGARLAGADLRGADLSHAQLDPSALSQSHWRGAIGMNPAQFTAAEWHNAAVAEAEAGRWPAAERLFTGAIGVSNQEPLSWAGRGISRAYQGQGLAAAADFAEAASLFQALGQPQQAARLEQMRLQVLQSPDPQLTGGGNGLGGAALEGVMGAVQPLASVLQGLAPLALKFLLPVPF